MTAACGLRILILQAWWEAPREESWVYHSEKETGDPSASGRRFYRRRTNRTRASAFASLSRSGRKHDDGGNGVAGGLSRSVSGSSCDQNRNWPAFAAVSCRLAQRYARRHGYDYILDLYHEPLYYYPKIVKYYWIKVLSLIRHAPFYDYTMQL
ncbi:unnamed protein product, partial [Amoebophrya sp. A25]|eukprot:GSA25T00021774001.1